MNQALEAYFRLMNEAGLIRLAMVFKGSERPLTDDYIWVALDNTGDWFAYTLKPELSDGIYNEGNNRGKMARYLACMKEEEGTFKPILIEFTDKL